MQRLRSYQLAIQFYGHAKRTKLSYALKTQLTRAASSIALNLAEGWGRKTQKERLRFYTIAMGSIRECQAVVDLETAKFNATTKDVLDHLAASAYKLIRTST